jgi:type II secretory pathway pseudopilin PulG
VTAPAPQAPARPGPQGPAGKRPATALRLVPQRAWHPPRAPFVVLVVGLLAAGLLGLLLLNTVMAENSFRLHALQQRGAALDLRQQQLQRDIDAIEAPGALAAHARALGMVPAGSPAFIRLSDGKVLGVPTPARSPQPVRLATPSPPARPVPTATARPTAARPPRPVGPAPFPAPTPAPGPR